MRQGTQPGDLPAFAIRVGRRQALLGLQSTDPLGDLEPLSHDVHDGSVQVVDAAAQNQQFF